MAKKVRPCWDDLKEDEKARVIELREKLDLLTVKDVALISGVTESTVQDWIARGNGPPSVKLGAERYFPRLAFIDYLNGIAEETLERHCRKTRSDSNFRKQVATGR